MVSGRSVAAALILLLASSALASEPGTTLTEGPGIQEPEKVYTNADLERYGPVADTPTPATDGPEWKFVTEFLDREYERLDADRAYDLERLRVEAESEALTSRHDRWSVPFAPYLGRPLKRYGHSPVAGRDSRGRHGGRGFSRSSVNYGIVPMHARPTLAMRHRARAIQHSGADAVPRR